MFRNHGEDADERRKISEDEEDVGRERESSVPYEVDFAVQGQDMIVEQHGRIAQHIVLVDNQVGHMGLGCRHRSWYVVVEAETRLSLVSSRPSLSAEGFMRLLSFCRID